MQIIDSVNQGMLEEVEREVVAMQKVNTPYAITVLDSFYDKFECQYCLVTELMPKGDLKAYIKL
jgi:serine/threonine protein kinase